MASWQIVAYPVTNACSNAWKPGSSWSPANLRRIFESFSSRLVLSKSLLVSLACTSTTIFELLLTSAYTSAYISPADSSGTLNKAFSRKVCAKTFYLFTIRKLTERMVAYWTPLRLKIILLVLLGWNILKELEKIRFNFLPKIIFLWSRLFLNSLSSPITLFIRGSLIKTLYREQVTIKFDWILLDFIRLARVCRPMAGNLLSSIEKESKL